MSKPQFIRTEAGEEFVVLSRRDYDAMRARLGDEDAEDRMTARMVKEGGVRRGRGCELSDRPVAQMAQAYPGGACGQGRH